MKHMVVAESVWCDITDSADWLHLQAAYYSALREEALTLSSKELSDAKLHVCSLEEAD